MARKSPRITKRKEVPRTPTPSPQTTPQKAPPGPRGGKKTTAAPSTPTPSSKKATQGRRTFCFVGRGAHPNSEAARKAASKAAASKKKKVVPYFTCFAWGLDPDAYIRRMKRDRYDGTFNRNWLAAEMERYGGRVTRSQARKGRKLWVMKEPPRFPMFSDDGKFLVTI